MNQDTVPDERLNGTYDRSLREEQLRKLANLFLFDECAYRNLRVDATCQVCGTWVGTLAFSEHEAHLRLHGIPPLTDEQVDAVLSMATQGVYWMTAWCALTGGTPPVNEVLWESALR